MTEAPIIYLGTDDDAFGSNGCVSSSQPADLLTREDDELQRSKNLQGCHPNMR